MLGGLALAFVVAGFLLPASTTVERRAVVPAPQATVFTVLNGFRNFNRWSPWADLDPDATYIHEGPVQGVGARSGRARTRRSAAAARRSRPASPGRGSP